MELINSWRSTVKQGGKISVKIRFGKITFFDIYVDKPKKRWGITILNIGIKNSLQKQK